MPVLYIATPETVPVVVSPPRLYPGGVAAFLTPVPTTGQLWPRGGPRGT